MGYYQQNKDQFEDCRGSGLSYNQVLDITDVEGSGEELTEPVTLTEAKNFCKIDVSEDDALITSLITAARQMCEAYTNIGFIEREIIVVQNNGNGGAFLPLGPIGTIASCKDIDGNDIDYVASGSTWKQILTPTTPILHLTYTAGYADLPENLKTGLLNAIMFLYDNRSQGTDNIGPIAQMILNPVRRVW